MNRFLASLFMMLLLSCGPTGTPTTPLDVQGHRGCRGLLPENTVPAFLHALDLGVTTLEMDAVISQDHQVVVSHEPFFNHEISLTPAGDSITEAEERTHNIYQMDYATISQYDVGSIGNARFPDQKKMKASKPLLAEVIAKAEAHQQATGREPVWYNIETKSDPRGDSTFHPLPEAFVDLLVAVIKEGGIYERTTLQSFDVRTLQVAKRKYPDLPLVLLIENEQGLEENIAELGFVPEVYSPYFVFVDEAMVQACQEKGMKLIPWTANESDDIRNLIRLGVDGIISDYPDRVLAEFGEENHE